MLTTEPLPLRGRTPGAAQSLLCTAGSRAGVNLDLSRRLLRASGAQSWSPPVVVGVGSGVRTGALDGTGPKIK